MEIVSHRFVVGGVKVHKFDQTNASALNALIGP